MEVSIFENVLFYFMLLFEICGYCYFLFAITKTNITFKKFIIAVVIIYILSFCADVFVNFTQIVIVKTIITWLSTLIVLKFILHQNLIRIILLFIIILFVAFTSELIAYGIINLLFDTNAESLIFHTYSNSFGLFIISLIYFIISLVYCKKDIKSILKYFSYVEIKVNYQLITILIIFIPQIILIFLFKYQFSNIFLILTILQLVAILYVTSKYSSTLADKTRIEQELKNVEIYNQMLTMHNEGIRGFKHDFNNIVQALGGFISLNNMDGLREYYRNGLLKECATLNTIGGLTPNMINEPAMYSIVANKYIEATNKNITFKIETMCNASKINMSKYDLSRIVGILLDNAIEASLNSENKEMLFRITTDCKNKKDIIVIENSFEKPDDFSIDDLFKKDFSTKKIKSGFGLYEVRKLIDKTPQASIFTNCTDTKFIQTLIIEHD